MKSLGFVVIGNKTDYLLGKSGLGPCNAGAEVKRIMKVEEKQKFAKILLAPIAEVVGIPRDKVAQYKWPDSQLLGLIIAEINRLKDKLDNQRRVILKLRADREIRGQQIMDFIEKKGRGDYE